SPAAFQTLSLHDALPICFLYELVKISGSGKWPTQNTSRPLPNKGHKEMIIFLTDFYEYNTEITETLKVMKTQSNEVIMLHLLGRSEEHTSELQSRENVVC